MERARERRTRAEMMAEERRMRLYLLQLKQRMAALDIQRVWRGHKARVFVSARRILYNGAARVMQKHYRRASLRRLSFVYSCIYISFEL